MKYTFYTLSDPDTLEVRYVGVTTNKIEVRFAQHKSLAVKSRDQTHKTKWFKSILDEGKLPIISVIQTYTCEDDSWESIEKELISKYTNLTNHHCGGKGVIIGERLATTASNCISIVKIHPWKDEVISTYESIKQAESAHRGKSSTGTINQTLKGKHYYSYGHRWSYANNIVFSPPLKYYFLCVNNVIVKEYSCKARLRDDLTRIMNTYDCWKITTNIPSISQ